MKTLVNEVIYYKNRHLVGQIATVLTHDVTSTDGHDCDQLQFDNGEKHLVKTSYHTEVSNG